MQIDTFGPFPVENDTALFLCSDGLYKVMKDARIRDLFSQSGGPRGAAQSMVATAYEDGSDDNISVAIAEFGEVKRDRAMGTVPIEFEPPPPASPADDRPLAIPKARFRALYVVLGAAVASALLYVLFVR